MTRIASRRQLFLGIFAALASALAVQSLVWPRWPSVAPLDGEAIERQLKAAGFRYRPLKPLPAQRSHHQFAVQHVHLAAHGFDVQTTVVGTGGGAHAMVGVGRPMSGCRRPASATARRLVQRRKTMRSDPGAGPILRVCRALRRNRLRRA